jgi:hypothetical protein
MLAVAYPVILCFLVFVILIEGAYLWWRVRAPWWRMLGGVAIANGITMLLGYPLMWLTYFLCEVGIFALADKTKLLNSIPNNFGTRLAGTIVAAAWLGPSSSHWAILVSFVVLLIPAFFLSGYVEAKIIGREYWLGTETDSSISIWKANVLSYLFLAAVGCLLIQYGLKYL